MHALKAWQSPNILAHKWGGGGGPPWGEFNGIGAKSAALLAAPGVLDPTAFYACINILHVLTRGGQEVPRPTKIEVKIFQVGSTLTHFSLLGDFFSLLAGS